MSRPGRGVVVARVLTLLAILARRRMWTTLDALASELACSTRTIRRDLAVLEQVGASVEWSGADGWHEDGRPASVRLTWMMATSVLRAARRHVP